MEAYRARISALTAEQVAQRLAWEDKYAELSGQKEQAKAQRALKSAQKKVGTCRNEVEAACLALKEAVKAADK